MERFEFVEFEEILKNMPFADIGDDPESWRSIYKQSADQVNRFLQSHDVPAVIARCAYQFIINEDFKRNNPRWFLEEIKSHNLVEQPEVEIIQSIALMQKNWNISIPAAPRSMYRFLSELPKLSLAFSHMQGPVFPDEIHKEVLIKRVRLQTMRYRNLFYRSDAEDFMEKVLNRVDEMSIDSLGYSAYQQFRNVICLISRIEERLQQFHLRIRNGLTFDSLKKTQETIDFLCMISSVADNVWKKISKYCDSIEKMHWAIFQLSEFCHAWPYMLNKDDLLINFDSNFLRFLESISIAPGELSDLNVEHVFMNNPIWTRPVVNLNDKQLFLPLPALFFGFPFQIFERVFKKHLNLQDLYFESRSKILEEKLYDIVASAMPNSKTYRGVMWLDDESGKLYESDVVSLVGNAVFIFEAKSGKLDDVARRGGEKSLLRNFKELFVEPGEQARRLERYIRRAGKNAKFWIKSTGKSIDLELHRYKTVYKFGICIEHFAILTSARRNIKTLGAINDEDAWAPILSIGELLLVWRHLDTEISFYHYLTRRANLEEVIDIEGDEQDILSLYLVNGLHFDKSIDTNEQIKALNIDQPVRMKKISRENRLEFETFGVTQRYFWNCLLKEIYYRKDLRHRFDIIQVVLNQDPSSLLEIEEKLRRWRRGLGVGKGGDIIMIRNQLGKRSFVLIFHFTKYSMSNEEWAIRSRIIARNIAGNLFAATDCAIMMFSKKTNTRSYDGISFHRFVAAEDAGLELL